MQIKEYSWEMFEGRSTTQLRKDFGKILKSANERIRTTVEKHGDSAAAYRYQVVPLLGSSYVKVAESGRNKGNVIFKNLPKNATDRQVRFAMQDLIRFMQSKTSTIAGIEQVKQDRIDRIKKEYPTISDGEAENILKFLGTPEGQELMTVYDSDQIVEVLQVKGAGSAWLSVGDIKEQANKWIGQGGTPADWLREARSAIDMESF